MWRLFGILAAILMVSTISPTMAMARWTATPVPGSSTHEGGAAAMLGRLPDLPLGANGATVTYADLTLQAASLAVEPPAAGSDADAAAGWLQAIGALSLPQSTARHWSRPEWREAFGFDLYQVEQAVEFSAPPISLTVLRGSFDPDELRSAWERAGYQPIDLGNGQAFAVRDDVQVDLADPVSRMALAHANVAAIADDGTLIFGSARAAVRAALAATAGAAPSFAGRAEIAPLLRSAPDDLASALFIHGELLQATPDPAGVLTGDESPEAFATRVAAERVTASEMPPVFSALLGQTAGAFPTADAASGSATPAIDPASLSEARLVAVLATASPATAEQGAAVIAERLQTGRTAANQGDRPWSAVFPEQAVSAVAGEPAIHIELVPAAGISPSILQSMVFQRDPGFLAWSW